MSGESLARALAGVAVLGALGLGLATFVGYRADVARVPTAEAIARAAAEVRRGYRPGDMVRVVPPWDESLWWPLTRPAGPEEVAEGATPVAFDALWRGPRFDPLDALRFARAWVIGTFDREPTLPAWLAPAPPELGPVQVAPHVQLARYAVAPLDVRGRLTDDFDKLRVARVPLGGKAKPCPRRGAEYHCGAKGWMNPRLRTRDVYDRDVRWLYAVPGPGTTALRVQWDAPTGEAMVVRAGFTLGGIRRPKGAETTVETWLDGARADRFVLAPHRYQLYRRIIPLPRPTGGGKHRVEFRIHTTDHAFRHLMIQADVLGEVPAAVRAWVARSPD